MSNSASALEIHSATGNPRRVTLAEIAQLALAGLNQMFEVEKGLFCKGLVRTPKALVRADTSLQNTLIALLPDLTGVDDPHESPTSPDTDVLDTWPVPLVEAS